MGIHVMVICINNPMNCVDYDMCVVSVKILHNSKGKHKFSIEYIIGKLI